MTVHVLVLHNEPLLPATHPDAESEHEITFTVDRVSEALVSEGFRVSRLAVGRDPSVLVEGLGWVRPDVVFNLFEGLAEDAKTEAGVAGVLEWMGVPFTGSSSQAIALSRSKPTSKFMLHAAGLPTPPFFVVEGPGEPRLRDATFSLASAIGGIELEWPVIVKAANEDASVGIDQGSVVTTPAQLRQRVGLLTGRYGPPILVEQYVPGRELTVGVLEIPDPRPLPPSEFVFNARNDTAWDIVTYDAKWHLDSVDFEYTPFSERASVEPELEARLNELAVKVHRLLGLRDYGRVDFRVTPAGEPFILEANPNPDIGPVAALTEGAASLGLTYAQFLAHLTRLALPRKGTGWPPVPQTNGGREISHARQAASRATRPPNPGRN